MTTTISKAYTATGDSLQHIVKNKQSYTYVVTGTFVATWIIETTFDQTNYEEVATGTGTQASVTVTVDRNDTRTLHVRSRCSAFTSGTMTVAVAGVQDAIDGVAIVDADGVTIFDAVDGSVTPITRTAQVKIITAGSKIGGTSGWLVDAANDKGSLAKLPASETSSTLVVKIPDLKVGDIITAFSVESQIESAGGTVTLDADLRAQTNVAAGHTDASIGTITQVSVTADTASSAEKTGLSETVAITKGYYILLTGTTAASTDIDALSVTVTVTEN